MKTNIELAKPYQWNGGKVEGWTFNTREELDTYTAAAIEQATAELSLAADKLADALRDIVKQDPVEMALDPQWAARVARITLTECGYEA